MEHGYYPEREAEYIDPGYLGMDHGIVVDPELMDWRESQEHSGLQGTAFPEVDTAPVQGALL